MMFQMVAFNLYLLCATPVSPDVLPDILLSAGFVRIFKLFEVLLPRSVDVSEPLPDILLSAQQDLFAYLSSLKSCFLVVLMSLN